MANNPNKENQAADEKAEMLNKAGQLRAWIGESIARKIMVSGGLLTLLGGVLGGWLYFTSLAIGPPALTIADAIISLEKKQYREAKRITVNIQSQGELTDENLGNALYIMGVAKSEEAIQSQLNLLSQERIQSEYLIASRYLHDAKRYGWPEGHEILGSLRYAKSLIYSLQYTEGILVLKDLMKQEADLPYEAHQLLTQAYSELSNPNWQAVIQHADKILSFPSLEPYQKVEALLSKVRALIAFHRYDKALKIITSDPIRQHKGALKIMFEAEALFGLAIKSVIEKLDHEATYRLPKDVLKNNKQQILAAQNLFFKAIQTEILPSDITSRCSLRIAQTHIALGEPEKAKPLLLELQKKIVETTGKLASLELLSLTPAKTKKQTERSLLRYELVLKELKNTGYYHGTLLSKKGFQNRFTEIFKKMLAQNQHQDALLLSESFVPLFTPDHQVEQQGLAYNEWALLLQNQGINEFSETSKKRETESRLHFREAGVAYEKLAKLRYSSPLYPNYLWLSAQNYYKGKSFSSVERVLSLYLKSEPIRKNAQALLLLGQAQLSKNNPQAARFAFEECIEFHPNDIVAYQARIDCAIAYREIGNYAKAEELLTLNFTGDLSPRSQEWKDSLYAIGHLFFKQKKYSTAIRSLEEAIERDPKSEQKKLAQYVVGESYRLSAQLVRERLLTSITENDKKRNTEEFRKFLSKALTYYNDLITDISHDKKNLPDPLTQATLRNCYMMQGAVLFDLGNFVEAKSSFSKVSSLYQHEPFALEAQIQIANCWRRLNNRNKARQVIDQAKLLLIQIPPDIDFKETTNFSRERWKRLLADMSTW